MQLTASIERHTTDLIAVLRYGLLATSSLMIDISLARVEPGVFVS